MIEISGVDAHLTELTIFFGGYSPVTSSKSLKLANKRRYVLDGSQQQFLIVEVKAENANQKPYFSLSYNKANDGSSQTSLSDFLASEADTEARQVIEGA